MKEDISIIRFRQPGFIEDPLTEITREGARRVLATALEAEIGAFIEQFGGERLPDGRQRVVRHGYDPERRIQTGVGPLAVRRPKVRDRAPGAEPEKVRFTSHILPKWARRARSLDALRSCPSAWCSWRRPARAPARAGADQSAMGKPMMGSSTTGAMVSSVM